MAVAVTGACEASLPPTWGLRFAWLWHGEVDEDAQVDTARYCSIPPGRSLRGVLEAIGNVFGRHDALRAVFVVEDGEVRQLVQRSGNIDVSVWETSWDDAIAVAEQATKNLVAAPWNGNSWPLRVAIVMAGEYPRFMVIAHNRLVLEGASVDIARQEILAACNGQAIAPPRWQVTQEALYQQSDDGRAVSDRAVAYWDQALATAPPSIFDYPSLVHEQPRYALLRMESAAAARAVQMLRRRWRVTGGTLVLAALSTVLSLYTGHGDIVFQLILGNRGDRNRRRMVGALASVGLLRLDLAGQGFEEIVRAAASASGVANQTGYCDPQAVLARKRELRLRRGVHLDTGLYFNDLQTGQSALDQEPALSETELRELARKTGIDGGSSFRASARDWPAWQESLQENPTRQDLRMFAMVQHGATMPLVLLCDTKYLSSEVMRRLLAGVERVLIAAACGKAPAADLARISGVDPVTRGPSWIRHGDGWLDLTATRELWRQVNKTDRCAIFQEAGRCGRAEPALVGYLAGDARPSFAEVHREFVAALGERNDVRAPDWYVWIAAPPEAAGDPALWRESPVLAQADGR
jgi:hypothetical protein